MFVIWDIAGLQISVPEQNGKPYSFAGKFYLRKELTGPERRIVLFGRKSSSNKWGVK